MSGNSQHITLKVEGMTCANCANTVKKQITRKGGKNAEVDFSAGEAMFDIDNGANVDDIIDGINDIGYRVQEEDEDDEEGSHGHRHGSPVEKKFWISLVFTVPLFMHMFLPGVALMQNPVFQLILCLPVFYIGLIYFGRSAWGSLKVLEPNMDVLITLGSSAAFIYSVAGMVMYYGTPQAHDYLFFETTATIITLVLLGNVLEHRSVKQTTTAISELNKIREAGAKRVTDENQTEEVAYENIRVGDILLVNTGDQVPADGRITWGEGSVDESMITGESTPVDKSTGDRVTGGTLLTTGSIRMEAEKVGNDTLLSGIIDLVKNAQFSKPRIQRLGDKVSAVFVPVVLLIAALTFFISHLAFDVEVAQALMNSVAVLVISCPCAMGLATPTAVMAGVGRAAKNGVLIKGGTTLETFAGIKNVVFDKTGTITTGDFRIAGIESLNGQDETGIRSVVLGLEKHSSHPIARSLVSELQNAEAHTFEEVLEEKGSGITGKDKAGDTYKLGSGRYVTGAQDNGGDTLLLSKNDEVMARITLSDEVKPGIKNIITNLHKAGIRTILLSGDSKQKTERIAQETGMREAHGEKSPEEKLKIIEKLSEEAPTAMVGDGVNDAPALARASVGVSIGNASRAAIESAQVVLLGEKDLSQLEHAHKISRHTLLTIKQNLFWAFFYNVLAIPIAAVGLLNPMIAALAMAASDVVVVGNSIRLKYKKV